MTISNAHEYVAAIAKREHLAGLLDHGTREFSGYGRELFQNSVSNNLNRLAAAIGEYEARLGYAELPSFTFCIGPVKDEFVTVYGWTGLPESSFASLTVSVPKPIGSNLGALPFNASVLPPIPKSLFVSCLAAEETLSAY